MTLDQVFGLYNYWIVIFLMMIGFYIVIARENFIKTIIGLNIFQISVILLYITMGKVNGGTAPIVPPEIAAQFAAHHHDEAHDHAEGHNQDEAHGHKGVDDQEEGHAPKAAPIHEKIGDHDNGPSSSDSTSSLDRITESTKMDSDHPGDHSLDYAVEKAQGISVDSKDIIYSNPIPSVLMLTAIVVGIATTALALALIVRIREDYGTIEENEVLELDRKS